MTDPLRSRFDPESFIKPGLNCAPVYIWVWNCPCTKELIDAQLSEMGRLGIRAFYILPEPKQFRPHSMPTELEPEYLTEEFWALIGYALEEGIKRGMNCWIYDEGGWPSGGACGRVLADHPEYAKSVISFRSVLVAKNCEYIPSDGAVLAAFDGDMRMLSPGQLLERDTEVTEYFAELRNGGGSDYPDLLNRRATEHFIELTHEGYASVSEGLMGGGISAVFTDEPKAPLSPLNAELIDRYGREYGSVLPYLPLIAGKQKVTEENAHILVRWHDLCSRVFCENFLLPCKKWTNDRGMAFTGHMDRDHDPLGCVRNGGHFHLMRALRCLDLPGIDVIWRQIYPVELLCATDGDNGYNGFFPRYASSAARNMGSELAMSESFGVLGPGVPYDIMRYIIGYQAVRGINVFNFFNIPMGRKGALLGQELPIFTEEQPYYRELAEFNAYVERLSYVASLGKRVCETALYYPVSDFWDGLAPDEAAREYDELGRAVEDRFVDFDIIDDEMIALASGAEKGILSVGSAEYRNILIPANAKLPPETAERISGFVRSGGRVFHSAAELSPEVVISAGEGVLRVCRRRFENGELMLIFREGGASGKFLVSVGENRVGRLIPESGRICPQTVFNGCAELCLELGETAVLLFGDCVPKGEAARPLCEELEIKTPFTFAKTEELTCDENGFGSALISGERVAISLGGWEETVGKAFCGSGCYETEFELTAELAKRGAVLDLGRVCYTAFAELNGVRLGKKIMSPYRFELPKGLLKEKNKLKITVVNTTANWYTTTDYFDRWEEKQLSTYFKGETEYARDYAGGGLWGPVKLVF